jgi:hypothetical protein
MALALVCISLPDGTEPSYGDPMFVAFLVLAGLWFTASVACIVLRARRGGGSEGSEDNITVRSVRPRVREERK